MVGTLDGRIGQFSSALGALDRVAQERQLGRYAPRRIIADGAPFEAVSGLMRQQAQEQQAGELGQLRRGELGLRREELQMRRAERARQIALERERRERERLQRERVGQVLSDPGILGNLSRNLGIPPELISGAGLSELGALGQIGQMARPPEAPRPLIKEVDGDLIAVDPRTGAARPVYESAPDPMEEVQLQTERLRQEQIRRDLSSIPDRKIIEQEGIQYFADTGEPVIKDPVKASKAGKFKDAELKAAGFASRMEGSNKIFNSLDAMPGFDSVNVQAETLGMVSGLGKRLAQTPDQQRYQNAADEWIRAKLRRESGAVIGEEEMASEYRIYFPQLGDRAEVRNQKRELRKRATEALIKESQGAFEELYEPDFTPVPQDFMKSQGWGIRKID